MYGIIHAMNSMMGIWTAFLLAALCASALAWIAALLHERGANPLRRLRAARPVSAPFQTAPLAIVAIGFIHHGATKSTNGVPDPGEPPDPDPPPPPPNPPSVSVSFDTDVVIFEDGYEDSPGVFKPRHSTTTKLTVMANGGDTGTSLDLTIVGGLEKCAGQSEMPTYVAPNQTFEWHANYEGVSASSSQGDIVVTVTTTPSVVGVNSEPATANATVVEVKVAPMVEAPENNMQGRHKVGVREIVSCQQFPSLPQVEWDADYGYYYNEGTSVYFCSPLYAATFALKARLGDVVCPCPLTIVEPQGIEARNMSSIEYGMHPGVAGYVGMQFTLHVTPLDVSFTEIAVEEVPCNQGTHIGYFAQPAFSNMWYHTRENGAGNWDRVKFGNRYNNDRAVCQYEIPKSYLIGLNGELILGWYEGYLSWNVPFGWNEKTTSGTTSEYRQFATDTMQEVLLDAYGTVTITKFDSWISRATNDVIMLYGDVR